MSIFPSLNYLLRRASSVIPEPPSSESTLNISLKPNNYSNKLSLIAGNESSNDNATSCIRNLNILMDTIHFSDVAELNKTCGSSTFVKWINFISTYCPKSKTNLIENCTHKGESELQVFNETFPDADFLLESWWNIFDERYLRNGWGWTITLIIAYIFILVAGVIGNVMVILVVLLRPQMRTVTNMFITNLAVADLFVIVFCVPSTLLANIFAPWILGSFMCKAVAYVQGVSVCASAYSLAAISLDRCQAIYRNYERPRGFSQTVCVRTIFVIWVAAMFLTTPWTVVFDIKISEYDGLRYCVESWKDENLGNKYFLVVNLLCFYTIPLLLIFVSNWIIYCHVAHRHVPQESASAAPIRKLHRHTRRVVLRMLGIVTLTFLFSWLPLYMLVIKIKFSETISDSDYEVLGILMPIAQWLGSCNSSVNPVLYAFLNKKFRRMFKSILPSWIPVKLAGQYEGSIRTPSFTNTAYTRRSFTRSRSDFNRHHQNGHRASLNHASLLISRFYEHTGTVATTTVQILSTTIPATTIIISDSPETLFDTVVAERNLESNEIITDL